MKYHSDMAHCSILFLIGKIRDDIGKKGGYFLLGMGSKFDA